MKTVKITIRKPIYGNRVCINSTFVDRAIRDHRYMEITIPNGTGIVDPREWKARNDTIEKVFLRPDEPMLLYCGNVPVPEKEPVKRELRPEDLQTKLF